MSSDEHAQAKCPTIPDCPRVVGNTDQKRLFAKLQDAFFNGASG